MLILIQTCHFFYYYFGIHGKPVYDWLCHYLQYIPQTSILISVDFLGSHYILSGLDCQLWLASVSFLSLKTHTLF